MEPSDLCGFGACAQFALTLLDTLPSHVAVLGRDGAILATNQAWRAFGAGNGVAPGFDWTGINYLTVCDLACQTGVDEAGLTSQGIRAVLEGAREEFEQVNPCHSPTESRWFRIRVKRLRGSAPWWAVVTHESVTQLTLAEEELVRSRNAAESLALAMARHERFVRNITDSLPAMVAYWDQAQRCQFANLPYQRWLGRDAVNLIGRTAQEVLEPTLYAQLQPRILAALAGRHQEFELSAVGPDGLRRDLLISLRSRRTGGRTCAPAATGVARSGTGARTARPSWPGRP